MSEYGVNMECESKLNPRFYHVNIGQLCSPGCHTLVNNATEQAFSDSAK